jgi:predicted hydrolase (HD superfamily)
MSVKSFRKKYKDRKFAAKCDRAVIEQGFSMLGMDPAVVMQRCIDGMTAHKEEIGL